MVELVAAPGVEIILMHRQGTPATMQLAPHYPQGVVNEVKAALLSRVAHFAEAGIARSKLWIDPGIGFGKTLTHNLELLNRLDALVGVGGRVVIGTSRKSFLAGVLGDPKTAFELREAGTLASHLWARQAGASVFRVHDVGAMKRAMVTWEAIRLASPEVADAR